MSLACLDILTISEVQIRRDTSKKQFYYSPNINEYREDLSEDYHDYITNHTANENAKNDKDVYSYNNTVKIDINKEEKGCWIVNYLN